MVVTRRAIWRMSVAAAGTLTATMWARKPLAAALHDPADALEMVNPPVQAPDVSFSDAEGKMHQLSEFRGHGMVINLWATWCAPCVAEMPSLAILSKALAPDDIAVLPLSSDRGGAKVVEAFLEEHDITGLPVLLDPKGAAARAFGARGVPTSILVDRQGRTVARLEGSADWSTRAAISTVKRLLSG